MKIYISTNPDSLRALKPTHTVETVYEGVTVEGSLITLAYNSDTPNDDSQPCIGGNIPPCHLSITNGADCNDAQAEMRCHRDCLIPTWTIGLSHIGLNTLGGVMRILNYKDAKNDRFWEIVADIDMFGVDKIITSSNDTKELAQLKAFWTWNNTNYFSPPMFDDNAVDVTEYILTAIDALKKIFASE